MPCKDITKSGCTKSKVNNELPMHVMPKTGGQKPVRRKDLDDETDSMCKKSKMDLGAQADLAQIRVDKCWALKYVFIWFDLEFDKVWTRFGTNLALKLCSLGSGRRKKHSCASVLRFFCLVWWLSHWFSIHVHCHMWSRIKRNTSVLTKQTKEHTSIERHGKPENRTVTQWPRDKICIRWLRWLWDSFWIPLSWVSRQCASRSCQAIGRKQESIVCKTPQKWNRPQDMPKLGCEDLWNCEFEKTHTVFGQEPMVSAKYLHSGCHQWLSGESCNCVVQLWLYT